MTAMRSQRDLILDALAFNLALWMAQVMQPFVWHLVGIDPSTIAHLWQAL